MKTMYIAWALFIVLWASEAWAQGGPGGLASKAALAFSCVTSAIFGFMVMSIPVAFTVYYFATYLNVQEKNRRQGRGSFYSDELILLALTSLMVAGLLRLLFAFWDWAGIPVESIMGLYLFCNKSGSLQNACTGLFPPESVVIPNTCYDFTQSRYFFTALFFLVGFGSFISKLILLFLPVGVFLVLLGKNMLSAYQMVKERQAGAISATFTAFVDALVTYVVLVFYVSVIYELLYVPWEELRKWLKVLIGGALWKG